MKEFELDRWHRISSQECYEPWIELFKIVKKTNLKKKTFFFPGTSTMDFCDFSCFWDCEWGKWTLTELILPCNACLICPDNQNSWFRSHWAFLKLEKNPSLPKMTRFWDKSLPSEPRMESKTTESDRWHSSVPPKSCFLVIKNKLKMRNFNLKKKTG